MISPKTPGGTDPHMFSYLGPCDDAFFFGLLRCIHEILIKFITNSSLSGFSLMKVYLPLCLLQAVQCFVQWQLQSLLRQQPQVPDTTMTNVIAFYITKQTKMLSC